MAPPQSFSVRIQGYHKNDFIVVQPHVVGGRDGTPSVLLTSHERYQSGIDIFLTEEKVDELLTVLTYWKATLHKEEG